MLINWFQSIRARTIALLGLAAAVCFTAVACSGGASSTIATATGPSIAPDLVADYIHTVLAADRTAYTKHVVNRVKTLEGKSKDKGVLDVESTEGWQQTDGIPLPAQMFRLGSEIANESGYFTYNLISTWYINDNHGPKSDFEQTALEEMEASGEAYKDYQEVGGQAYFSAMYPDKAVAEACVTCHNTHPIHLERYPDKQFEMGEVMGGVVINIPIESMPAS
ncbi:Tll0287-like domain-containing protein [Adonisia turfae]